MSQTRVSSRATSAGVQSQEWQPAVFRFVRRRLLGAVVAAFAVSGFAVAPGAQAGESVVPLSVSQQLFQRGRQAASEKDWQRAFSLFERSFQRQPSYDTAANLGQAALKLERYPDAAHYLTFALENFPPSGDMPKWRAIHGWLEIALLEVAVVEALTAPDGAVVLIDGGSARSSHRRRWYLRPGEHDLSVRAEGFLPRTESLVVRAGKRYQINLQLTAAGPGAKDAAVAPASSDWRQPLPILLVGGGLTVASAAVGIGFGMLAENRESEAEALGGPNLPDCLAATGDLDSCKRAGQFASEADERRSVSYVGYGVASLALVGTVALLLWPEEGRDGAARSGPGLMLSRDGAALSVHGSF